VAMGSHARCPKPGTRRPRRIESRLRVPRASEAHLITLGIICLIVAALFWSNPILWTIGVILVVLGLIFWILGAMGRAIGGRRHYY
jgi:peptidoglycan/LPS O-acetylase OafA/YrhL